MEVEEYLGSSRLYRRLRSGPHGQLVERYAARLVEERLVRHGAWRCLNVVSGLLSWIADCRYKLVDLDEQVVERYLRHRGGRQSIQPGDRAALKRWLSVLRAEGAIAPLVLLPLTPHERVQPAGKACSCRSQELPVFEGQERVAARAEAQRCDGTAASRRRLFCDRAVARS